MWHLKTGAHLQICETQSRKMVTDVRGLSREIQRIPFSVMYNNIFKNE